MIRDSDLDWVIVRPARLTDEPAKGEYKVFLQRGFLQSQDYITGGRCGFYASSTEPRVRYVHKTPVISN